MKRTPNIAALLSIALIMAFVAALLVRTDAQANSDLAKGRINGVVFQDSNQNGVREPNELPLANHPVYLQRTGEEVVGAMVAVTYSDANGDFVFDNLEEGKYQVFPDEGEYVLLTVEGVNASATAELAVPVQMHQIFLPLTAR